MSIGVSKRQLVNPANIAAIASGKIGTTPVIGNPTDQQILKFIQNQGAYIPQYFLSPFTAWAWQIGSGFSQQAQHLLMANGGITKTGTESLIAGDSATPIRAKYLSSAIASSSTGFTTANQSSSNRFWRGMHFSYVRILNTGFRFYFGMVDGAAETSLNWRTDTPNRIFVGFRCSSAAGETTFQAMCQTSSVNTTKVDTGVTVDNNDHNFEMRYDDTVTTYSYYIDGVLVATISSNVPNITPDGTHGTGMMFFMDNVGTANAVAFQIGSMDGIGRTI